MRIPQDARATEFPGVYMFNSDRYLITAVQSTALEYHARVATVHGNLQTAIDRRAELVEELAFDVPDHVGPYKRRPKSVNRLHHVPPTIWADDEDEER